MLAALLFAGLAAAAILPAAFDGLTDDDDDADMDGSEGPVGKAGIPQHAPAPADEPQGTVYEVSATSGSEVLGAFDAASDTCTVTTDTLDGEFEIATDPSGTGATLCFTTAAGDSTVLSFPHLDAVPVHAIGVRIDSDEGTTILPLAEIFAAGEEIDAGGDDDAQPLAPTDPDAPDILPELLDPDEVLSSIDPDLADVLPTDLPDGDVLQPVIDATGLIRIDPDTGLPKPITVTDFTDADILSVTLSDAAAKSGLDVVIEVDPSGKGVVVLVDGKALAILPDAKAILPSQIQVSVAGKGLI
jgi:hypothetical protein